LKKLETNILKGMSRARTRKRCKFDPVTSARYTLDNVNAGGTLTFKPHNLKSI